MRRINYLLGFVIVFISVNTVATERRSEVNLNDNDKVKVYINSNCEEIIVNKNITEESFSNYEISYKGKIFISDDDKSIKSISPNGFLHIEKSAFGNERIIKIESDENGNLTKKYFEGKSEIPFDPKGKEWLSEILIDVIRSSGIGAEERVKRIYKQKGIDGVLEEINEISKSYTRESKVMFIEIEVYQQSNRSIRNLYFKIMIDELNLSDQDLAKILPVISEISSNSTKGTILREILYKYKLSNENIVKLLESAATLDYNTERGSILRVLNPTLPNNNDVLEAYFSIIKDMEINSEKGNVIKHLIKNNNTLNTNAYKSILNSLYSFSSEREKGAILIKLAKILPNDKELMSMFYNVVNDMDRDYYVLKGEIMAALSERGMPSSSYKPDKSVVIGLLGSSVDLISNSQRGLNLRRINKMFIDDQEVLEKYFEVVEGFSNKLEEYNVLLDLIEKNKLSDEALIQIYKRLRDYLPTYQHAAGAILRSTINQLPNDKRVQEYFFDVIEGMDQNSTIEEILRLLCQNKNLEKNDDLLIRIIEASEIIDVDIETASVLLDVREVMPKGNSDLNYIYKSAAKTIKSDYYINKVLATIE